MKREDIESYKKFIHNKNVIFVGPAPTLINKNQGKWIDSTFDVVIRTNGSIFLLKDSKYRKDYGSRCDSLYSNVQFLREMGPFPIEEWKNSYRLKYLNMKTGSRKILDKYDSSICVRSLMHIIPSMQNEIPGLLMGPIIVRDILEQNPKSLYVTGMDFYISKPLEFIPGDYREYYPNYLPEKIRMKADRANVGRKDPHDQFHNTMYFYDKWQEGFIQVDETMKLIMSEIVNHPEKYTNKGKGII